jgi:site-specific recombinase XerC
MPSPEINAIYEVRTLVDEYEQFLSRSGKAEGTTEAYLRTVRHLMGWVVQCPCNAGQFQPQHLTQTAVELYLAHLEQEGFTINHRARVKSTISNFAQFLIEEKGLLQRNPTRGIDFPLCRCSLLASSRKSNARSCAPWSSKQAIDAGQFSLP